MIFDVDDKIAIKDDAKNGTFDALLFLQFILFLKIFRWIWMHCVQIIINP